MKPLINSLRHIVSELTSKQNVLFFILILFCSIQNEKNNKQTPVDTRGGVEDTRLEAKAKDTKKIQGQGQPFRGQNLSRPRTGMLEAKDRGHRRMRSPKKEKKGLQN